MEKAYLEEKVCMLHQLTDELYYQVNTLHMLIGDLSMAVDKNGWGMGPHVYMVENLIRESNDIREQLTEAAEQLIAELKKKTDLYETFLEKGSLPGH